MILTSRVEPDAHKARNHLSAYFGVSLLEKNPSGFPKKFDMVAEDDKIIGDAKFLTLVRGEKLPPAKLYALLSTPVEFYFLDEIGNLTNLKE